MDTRKEYRELSETEKDDMWNIKHSAEQFWETLDCYKDGRAKSIAQTKLEEAVMWAVKHITE